MTKQSARKWSRWASKGWRHPTRHRDVLRARLIEKIYPVDQIATWDDLTIDDWETISNTKVRILNGPPSNNQKAAELTMKVRGEALYFKEPLKVFPSEKLLAQLALVL